MSPVNVPDPAGPYVLPPATAAEAAWYSRIPWNAIVAGALAGFAATLILSTLGAAISATAGAVVINETAPGSTDAGAAGVGFGIGAAAWMLLTSLLVGAVGGFVLARVARFEHAWMPWLFGALTWTVGVLIALLVISSGAGGLLGASSGLMTLAAERTSIGIERDADTSALGATRERSLDRPMTQEEKDAAALAADRASKAAAGAAWLVLGSQLLSLAATMLVASWRRRKLETKKITVRSDTRHPPPFPATT